MKKQIKPKTLACQILAMVCKIELEQILQALRDIASGSAYREIKIPKRSKGFRTAFVPNDNLKEVQKAILSFLYGWKVDKRMHGFVKRRSIITNALSHLNRENDHKDPYPLKAGKRIMIPKWIVRIDLKDAFPSVTREVLNKIFTEMFESMIGSILENKGKLKGKEYPQIVLQFTRLLSYLATYNGVLLQGTSIAPYLFNLALFKTGTVEKIAKVCHEWRAIDRLQFSLYGDDITISATKIRIPDQFIQLVIKAIEEDGIFTVNRQKTKRTWAKQQSQQITGIKLTAEYLFHQGVKLTLPQKTIKSLRGKINRAAALVEKRIMPEKKLHGFTLEIIRGYIAWIKQVYSGSRPPTAIAIPIKRFHNAFKPLVPSTKVMVETPLIPPNPVMFRVKPYYEEDQEDLPF